METDLTARALVVHNATKNKGVERAIIDEAPNTPEGTPPGQETGGVVPFRFLDRSFTIDRTAALWIPVKPREGVRLLELYESQMLNKTYLNIETKSGRKKG